MYLQICICSFSHYVSLSLSLSLFFSLSLCSSLLSSSLFLLHFPSYSSLLSHSICIFLLACACFCDRFRLVKVFANLIWKKKENDNTPITVNSAVLGLKNKNNTLTVCFKSSHCLIRANICVCKNITLCMCAYMWVPLCAYPHKCLWVPGPGLSMSSTPNFLSADVRKFQTCSYRGKHISGPHSVRMCVIQREWVADSAFYLLEYTSKSSTCAYLRAFALACHSRDSYKEW